MSVEYPASSKTRLWNIWKDMKTRCYQKGDKDYKSYGAKGIEVCPEWKSNYPAFREWALTTGYNDDMTIDRKDGSLGYSPDNCQWLSWLDNVRKHATEITAFGETKKSYEWIDDDRSKVNRIPLLKSRIRNGWTPEEAITTPVKRKVLTEDERFKKNETTLQIDREPDINKKG